jgi:hypothetical protein
MFPFLSGNMGKAARLCLMQNVHYKVLSGDKTQNGGISFAQEKLSIPFPDFSTISKSPYSGHVTFVIKFEQIINSKMRVSPTLNWLVYTLLTYLLLCHVCYPDHIRARILQLLLEKIPIQRIHFKSCSCQQMFHLEAEDAMQAFLHSF